MDDLIAFLNARLDEDEARAQAAAGEWDDESARYEWEDLPDATFAHARWHDPARVLREVEAKRAILTLHALQVTKREQYAYSSYTGEPIPDEYDGQCEDCGWFDPEQGACLTLRHLASVYGDHPDYREDWQS